MWKYFSRSPFLQSHYKSVLLVVLVSLFLLQRGGLLLFGYTHIAHPSFDETVSGVLTCDLLDGEMRAPLFAYQGEARSGDGLIEGFLLVPFFKFLGRSLFSLKMLALLSAFLTLLCWISLIKKYQGIWAAIIVTALFAFPPPMFARLNLLGTIASHHLINPLMALQLLLLFRILDEDTPQKPLWLWFGFGLLAGLGIFTFYTYIIFNSFCIVFLIIVRPRIITVSKTLLFVGGGAIGFLPWIIRSLFSGAGGGYLISILRHVTLRSWSFIQNFCFVLPHSFGYSYPSRDMGIISPLFVLFMACMGGVIIAGVVARYVSLPFGVLQKKGEAISLPALQGIFVICFPLFFLSCLSLASMVNGPLPFEYWPGIGFFGYFSTADVYRYRWLHLLFPFYFGIVGVGLAWCTRSSHTFKRYGATGALLFFLVWGLIGTLKLYSRNDYGRIFYCKGYNYDHMGHRFLLSDLNRLSLKEAVLFTANYPLENRGNAYRCLGTAVTLEVCRESSPDKDFERLLKEVPLPYLNDFIFGVVRAEQNLTEKEFQPVKDLVVKKYGRIFYAMWGFRTLGYRYYDLFLNREKILEMMPVIEKWFFADYLKLLRQNMPDHGTGGGMDAFLNEFMKVPTRYQSEVMRGVGMLVGAEMLFDPLETVNYPLDSRIGEHLARGLYTDAFYEGIGAGFAETLSRFFRTLLMPPDLDVSLSRTLLDTEWDRCQAVMSGLAPAHTVLIKKGFVKALRRQNFNDTILRYLTNNRGRP